MLNNSSLPSMRVGGTSSLSTKALKTMGLSAQDLYEGIIGDKAGCLTRKEYIIFWQSLSFADQNRDVSRIARSIINTFMRQLEGATISASPRALLHMMVFFTFWLITKHDSIMKKNAKALLDISESIAEPLRSDEALDIVKCMYDRICEEKTFDLLIKMTYSVHSNSTLQQLETSNNIYTFDRINVASRASAFFPHYLSICCKNSVECREVIFSTMIQTLKLIDEDLAITATIQDQVKALLFLLRTFVSYWRICDANLIREAIDIITQYYMQWPSPYCILARRLLLSLKQELVAPGNAILERFAAESRVPETTCSIEEQGETSVKRCRPIFYVVDRACAESSNWSTVVNLIDADTFMSGDDKMFASGLSSDLQALLLLNILYDEKESLDPNDIYSLMENDVIELFGDIVNMLQESLELNETDSAAHRSRNITNIRVQFTKKAELNRSNGVSLDLNLPKELPEDFAPSLPDIAHVQWLVNRDYHFPSLELITQLQYTPFPKTPLSAKIFQLIRLYEAFADENDPVEIRLCIAGGDCLLHQVTTAYADIVLRHPDLLVGISMRFFLIPFKSSLMAAFLARHDSWYFRQIYAPFRDSEQLLPQMTVESPLHDTTTEDSSTCAPGCFIRTNVESFVRDAEYVFHAKLFKIEGWKDAPSREGHLPDLVVPLLERCEIGKVACAMLFKNLASSQGTMGSVLDLRNVFKDKDFHYNALELNLQISLVDLNGETCDRNVDLFGARKAVGNSLALNSPSEQNAEQETTHIHTLDDDDESSTDEEPIPFERIVLSNVPCAEDPAFPANPQDPWLELYAKVWEAKTKVKSRYAFLINEPTQHITHMTLSSPLDDSRFHVVVDGEVFGAFHTVRISPIEHSNGEQISLPLSTFFPLQI